MRPAAPRPPGSVGVAMPQRAMALCLITLACSPSGPSPFLRAQQAQAAGEWIQAESLYRRALRDEPANRRARRSLAELLVRNARHEWEESEDAAAARAALGEALDLEPRLGAAHALEARMGLDEDTLELAEAETLLRRSLDDDPNSVAVRMELGQVLLELGRPADALEQFHLGSRLAPTDLRFQVLLAEALHPLNPEDSLRRLGELRARHPDAAEVLFGLARLFAREGRFVEAEALLREAETRNPHDPSLRRVRRRLAAAKKEWDVRLDDGHEDEAP